MARILHGQQLFTVSRLNSRCIRPKGNDCCSLRGHSREIPIADSLVPESIHNVGDLCAVTCMQLFEGRL